MSDEADRMQRATALREYAESERRLGHGRSARDAYIEAVALLRECADPLKLAHTVRHLGDVYRHENQHEAAGTCYDEALAIYRARADAPVLDVANALRAMAVLQEQRGDDATAERLWSEAGPLYERAGVTVGLVNSMARLALIAWKRGDRDRASAQLKKAIAAAEGDPDSLRQIAPVRAAMEGSSAPG